MDVHIKNIDESLEEIKHFLRSVTEEIKQITDKIDKLENDLAIQKGQGDILMARQTALEQKENDLQDQVQNLQMTSCRQHFSTVEDFSQGK